MKNMKQIATLLEKYNTSIQNALDNCDSYNDTAIDQVNRTLFINNIMRSNNINRYNDKESGWYNGWHITDWFEAFNACKATIASHTIDYQTKHERVQTWLKANNKKGYKNG